MEKELFEQLPQLDRIEYQLKVNQIDTTYYPFLILIIALFGVTIGIILGKVEIIMPCMLLGLVGFCFTQLLENFLCVLLIYKLDKKYIKMFELKKVKR